MDRRQNIFDTAFNCNIAIKNATKDSYIKQGIHLLNPSLDELEDAIIQASRDLYETIYIHSAKTWPNKMKKFNCDRFYKST